MASFAFANSMLLLNVLLIGLCLAHPINDIETQGWSSDEPLCTSGPLGMESGAIPDGSLTASSYYSSTYLPRKARLNEGNSHWWAPATSAKQGSWIQVDLGLPGPVITGLIIQCRPSEYLITFSIQYSSTGESESWHDLENAEGDTIRFNKDFTGGQRVTVTFPQVLKTRFLRILPITWISYPDIAFEVLGCRDGIIRLAGGDDALRGRVEIYHDSAWGAVCDTNWDIQDATTVCRQLGFPGASEAKNGSFYGATELPIVMDRVACNGTELYLRKCSYLCKENSPCTSTAGLICNPRGVVRLVGGPTKTSGRVEIYVDGKWGAICDTEWDITDAEVICKQLGYRGAKQAKSGAFFGQGSGPNLIDGVKCDGSEAKITDCPSHCWEKPKCNNTETAGVICVEG
ncbi:neurotrypsin-like [Asterias amurensis]|uniref:neurotrypsin-like n=1 Tax=Asterias amurensis TaxID=7602 RepID=UPI003AB3054E